MCHVSEVRKSIQSFKPGSAVGMNSLRPQHLKDLTNENLGINATNLLASLSSICDLMYQGNVPENVCPIVYGASLCGLNKKDGGIRPFAVGLVIRRLAAKIACSRTTEKLSQMFYPLQLGFGIKSGVEIGVHSACRYLSFQHNSTKVFLKIDFYNAFNMLDRGKMISAVLGNIPEFFPFLNQCYQSTTNLCFGNFIIPSPKSSPSESHINFNSVYFSFCFVFKELRYIGLNLR